MKKQLIADAISGMNERWVFEALMYSPKKHTITRINKKRFGVMMIAAIIVVSIIATALATEMFPGGISFSELYPFSGYHKWSDNYSYKSIVSQQAIVLEDITLKDNYTFDYSSQEKTGDQKYNDLVWKTGKKSRLKKGDIVDVVYYGDTYSTVCLSIKGKYHEIENGKVEIPYGILKSSLLCFKTEEIKKGNQAQLFETENTTADEQGRYLMKLKDSPNGDTVELLFTKDVNVLQRKNGWAEVQSWDEEEQTGWCMEDRLFPPIAGWNIYSPVRCAEDDKEGDSEQIENLMIEYLKSHGRTSFGELFVSTPNAFITALKNFTDFEQNEIIHALEGDLKDQDRETIVKILELTKASAIDEKTYEIVHEIEEQIHQ